MTQSQKRIEDVTALAPIEIEDFIFRGWEEEMSCSCNPVTDIVAFSHKDFQLEKISQPCQ